jgi:methylase of polypeptide subunit release factors
LVASDWEQDDGVPDAPDHVVGVSAGARFLAQLLPPRPVRRALDLGTGCGFHALLLAGHAGRVVGTDINERALALAAFNALLNGLDNVDLRAGNLFEPVAGETFDLVVANPPYVVSPDSSYVFRDSGVPGHEFCEALVRQLPAFLEEGALAYLLVSWVHRRDQDWSAPLRGWLEGSGCDAVLLHYVSSDPLTYAAGWNRMGAPSPEVLDETLDRWLAYYERLGIEEIGWGAMVLRRREGPNWVFAHSPSTEEMGHAGEHLLRLVAAQDYLASTVDAEAMLGDAFALAGDHAVEQTATFDGGALAIERVRLRLRSGLRLTVGLDPATAEVLSRLDGRRALGDVLAEVAGIHGGSPEAFAAAALPALRRLLELGFVVPVVGGR